MESAVLPAPSGPALRTRLQRRHQLHHTYPRSSPPELQRQGSQSLVRVTTFSTRAVSQHDLPQQPDLTVKLGARISREAVKAWSARVGGKSKTAPADKLQLLFSDLSLYPTKTQVFEMLVCAKQCTRRTTFSMSFGEFCLFASHLRRHSHRQFSLKNDEPQSKTRDVIQEQLHQNKPISKTIVETTEEKLKTEPEADSKADSKYEVFLGGSCNPTTWRTDIAIPTLEKMGISYFNPQVKEWSLDLMEQEHFAKRTARVLFFVLDAETRAAASAVEAAHLAAGGRPLVIVLQPYKRGQQIGNDTLSDQEYIDLSRGQAILQEVAERRSLPVFTELAAALRCTQLLLRGSPLARPPHNTAMASYLIKLKQAFDGAHSENDYLNPSETIVAVQSFTGIELTQKKLQDLMVSLGEKADQDVIDFELFCTLLAEIVADSHLPDDIMRSSSVEFDDLEVQFQSMARKEAGMLLDSLQSTPTEDSKSLGEAAETRWSQLIRRMNSAISALITKIEFNGSSRSENVNPLNGHHGQSTYSRRRESGSKLTSSDSTESQDSTSTAGSQNKPARKLSVFIPKVTVSSNGVSLDSSSCVLTPQSSRRLDCLAETVKDAPVALRDVYLGGSCGMRTNWREEIMVPILQKHGFTYYSPAINDYNRMFSAPPFTPAVGGRFTFDTSSSAEMHRKHDRSSVTRSDSDQPEKKPKYSPQEEEQAVVDLRPFPISQVSEKNRLSASDFYKLSGDASPAPFRGMYDERQVCGSKVLLFGVTKDTRCLAPMVLAAHCVGTRAKSLVLCIQLLTKVEGLSEQAIKDYNRGRLYLKDLAQRSGVPVFDDLVKAAQCVVRKLQHNDY